MEVRLREEMTTTWDKYFLMWQDGAYRWNVWTVAHEESPSDLVRKSQRKAPRTQRRKSQVSQDNSRKDGRKTIKGGAIHHSFSFIHVKISLFYLAQF